MNRTDLKREMESFCGGGSFIRKKQLAQFMNMKDPNTCNRYLAGLDHIGVGYYFIPDVVEAITDRGEEVRS